MQQFLCLREVGRDFGQPILLSVIIFFMSILSSAPGNAKPLSNNLLDNTPVTQAQQLEKQGNYQQAMDMYLLTAKILPPTRRGEWRSKAAEMALQAGNLMQADKIIKDTDEKSLQPESLARLHLVAANIAYTHQDHEQVIKLLDLPRKNLPAEMNDEILSLLSDSQEKTGNRRAHTALLIERYGEGDNDSYRLWNELMAFETQDLSRWFGETSDVLEKGWIELAYIAKTIPSKEALNAVLVQWEERYPKHPANTDQVEAVRNQQKIVPGELSQIAILLPTSGSLSHLADVIVDGIMAAKFNLTDPQTEVRFYDTNSSQDIYSLYQQATSEGAELIIGPMSKPLVDILATSPLTAPIITLNYGNNPELYNPNLFQFALLPEDEARQVAERITQDGLSKVGIVTPDSPWGERIAKAFNEHFTALEGTVVTTAKYGPQSYSFSTVIERAFKPSEEEGNGVGAEAIFMVAAPKQARILKPLLKFHYLGELPTYATSHVYSGPLSNTSNRDLNELIFTEIPWLLQETLDNTGDKKIPQVEELDELAHRHPRLFALGYDSLQLAADLHNLVQSYETQHVGLSGNLYIDSYNRVHRRLGLAQFRRGEPVTLALPLTSSLPPANSSTNEKPATRK
jgi:outer membrane PBP1 activator LpoA protein